MRLIVSSSLPAVGREVVMRAVVFSDWQTFPSGENVDQPEPRAGDLFFEIDGAPPAPSHP